MIPKNKICTLIPFKTTFPPTHPENRNKKALYNSVYQQSFRVKHE